MIRNLPRHYCIAITFALFLGLRAVAQQPATQPATQPAPAAAPVLPPAGATMLFNGKDITGFRVFLEDKAVDPKSVWSVKDGVLAFNTKSRGYLVTEKTYSNYHLHVEWRWPADAVRNSNSGVLVHQFGDDMIWPKSFECQLQNNNAGQVVGMDLDIPAAPVISNRKRAPRLTDPSEKPLGQWNYYDIHAKGNTIEVFVNGVKQNAVKDLPISAGAISLQMEGFPIEFRNVWMKSE
jgi:hypothetical protein